MEKKDYFGLHSKYSFLKDSEERYRNDLIAFIHEAFDKHGGVFELKTEGSISWEERAKDDEFNALDELPYYLLVGVDDDNSHEIHINRIHDFKTDLGYRNIDIDGWDWYDGKFVERCNMNYDIESLSTVADFINAVLEQEQQGINF